MKIQVLEKKLPADTITPVSLYLRLRDRFPGALLLESSDYHAKENSLSFLCLDPIAGVTLHDDRLETELPGGQKISKKIAANSLIFNALDDFFNQFQIETETKTARKFNGFFGYSTYDAVQFFENIELADRPQIDRKIPLLCYRLFRFVVCIDHFKDTMTLLENLPNGQISRIDDLENLIASPVFPSFKFQIEGDEQTNMTDDFFKKMVTAGKNHCQRGDVFQVVVSRQFSQKFTGDEFNVYRALRSVNPSPYLFYFDFGDFRLFGSSPEAQIRVTADGGRQTAHGEKKKAIINPIAGTVRRTGDDNADRAAAEHLVADPKENAEHIMLVDLARNDLSRIARKVRVSMLKDVQFFSHVIHLVSTVEGEFPVDASRVRLLGETFPAGTLSGAPKFRAMQIIDHLEPQPRGFYGGCIGFFNFENEMNHAILIRSFLSKNNTLHFQAGAGVVKYSDEESETQEVFNKIGALRRAVKLAASF